ncbi:iron chaperone [Piscibacillus sp. B03]|uniref:iron chaperone n=1 Tax=Piscibacillus sp. B03 TaxID=3457430 RepID=UPI003FCD902A
METHKDFLETISDTSHRERLKKVLDWIQESYPKLEPVVKWNQPMFQDHGTFIIAFSVSKKHMAVAPETVTIEHLEEDIKQAGYDYTKHMIPIPWKDEVNYSLLQKIIDFNIIDKADYTTFWRK